MTSTVTQAPAAKAGQGRNTLHRAALVIAMVLVSLLWSYWPTITGLWSDWQEDLNYSVGQLVPPAALYVLWHQRARLRGIAIRPNWWGAPVVLAAQAARAFGLLLMYGSAERYSLVLTIAGLVLWLGGTEWFQRVFWILAFLLLMVPLPGQVHNAISGPLQTIATAGAVLLLEFFGVPAAREGNVIVLRSSTPLAVAEACSGLRMLTAFVVVGSTMAFLVNRPIWQKVVLVLSTVPVALACNLIRLVITAVLFTWFDSATAEKFFHDFAGWTMMPMAIAMLLFELWILKLIEGPELQPATN